MEIQCGNCHYQYDFKLYGERCPQCGFENKPFRSQSARMLMGYEDDILRNRYFDHNRAERRERFLRSGDPDYGKSPLRRIRKYIFTVALCFAVLMIGQTLMRVLYVTNPPAAPLEKPPLSELASADFHAEFPTVDGVHLLVKYAGTVPDEKLGAGQRGRVSCIFVDVWATLEGDPPETFPGAFFILVGEQRYRSRIPLADGADMDDYTPFDMAALRENGRASGQFFFYLPKDTDAFTLCWDTGRETLGMNLHL